SEDRKSTVPPSKPGPGAGFTAAGLPAQSGLWTSTMIHSPRNDPCARASPEMARNSNAGKKILTAEKDLLIMSVPLLTGATRLPQARVPDQHAGRKAPTVYPKPEQARARNMTARNDCVRDCLVGGAGFEP